MEALTRIGMDTSKNLFQLHGVDEAERPVLRRRLRRSQIVAFMSKLAPARVGIEAGSTAHYWARIFVAMGHEVRIMALQLVKPYVKRGKNDAADAEALCEAMSRPTMRFVSMKSAEQQADLMLVSIRDRLVRSRTQLTNAIRGYVAEFGLITTLGTMKVTPFVRHVSEDPSLPEVARALFRDLADELTQIEARVKKINGQIAARHRQDELSQRLSQIPGATGPVRIAGYSAKSSGITRPLRLIGTSNTGTILASGLWSRTKADIWTQVSALQHQKSCK